MIATEPMVVDRLPSISLDELVAKAGLQTRQDRKYLVNRDGLQDLLGSLPSGVQALEIGQRRRFGYQSDYYDTADLRLTRAKVTLRRRTGGKDDGWHIKLPGSTGRTELHAELTDPSTPPAELLDAVRAIIRREPLAPIAQVEQEIGVKLVSGIYEEEIDTLGGLIFMLAGRVPGKGEVVTDDSGVQFEIIDADARRIKRVRARLPDAPPPPAAG